MCDRHGRPEAAVGSQDGEPRVAEIHQQRRVSGERVDGVGLPVLLGSLADAADRVRGPGDQIGQRERLAERVGYQYPAVGHFADPENEAEGLLEDRVRLCEPVLGHLSVERGCARCREGQCEEGEVMCPEFHIDACSLLNVVCD